MAHFILSVFTSEMTTNIKTKGIEDEKSKIPLHAWLWLTLFLNFSTLNWTLTGPRTHWGFFPLWLGHCLAMDGLVFWRTFGFMKAA